MTAPTPQLTAAQVAALVALIEVQANARQQLTSTAVAAAQSAFRALPDWFDTTKIARAVADVLRVVQPAQRQLARTTDAYLARAISTMTGARVGPVGAAALTELRHEMSAQVAKDLVDGNLTPGYLVLGEHDPDRRRVDPTQAINTPVRLVVPRTRTSAVAPTAAYGRIADAYRFDVIANNAPEGKALDKALVRVAAVASTDMTLAVRAQVNKTLGQVRGVTGYRRILRPELSQTGPCGLCVVAADRVYKVEDLHPLHDRCVCEVLPIIGALDPGLALNASDLRAIYNEAGSTGGGRREKGALKRIRVALAEHGELGPVLVDADTDFRGPAQVATTRIADKATRLAAQLDSFDERLGRLLRRRAAGEDVDAAIQWQTARIDKLQHELAGLGAAPTKPGPPPRTPRPVATTADVSR